MHKPIEVAVIGAGLGGLACAIACRRACLPVRIYEKAPEILEVGAGIQVPPNSTRVLETWGLMPKMRKIATEVKHFDLRRYADGKMLCHRPITYSTPWPVVHRADYVNLLLQEAKVLGAEFYLNSGVKHVEPRDGTLLLEDGSVSTADVIIGADGIWSHTRESVLGMSSPPTETGDLAYRGTFTLEKLKALNDPRIDELCKAGTLTTWIGPDGHAVFYPVRGGKVFNVVLIRPDDLPSDVRKSEGDIKEMRWTFSQWDDVLRKMIGCIPSVLKWKLLHHHELDKWTEGNVALLGDACHPTLPYQAQGAAMAVEDGGTIGLLLGLVNETLQNGVISNNEREASLARTLSLYEALRKHRTTINVKGAVFTRRFYHMQDGPDQEERDNELTTFSFVKGAKSRYLWCDYDYNHAMMEFDTLRNAEEEFNKLLRTKQGITPSCKRKDRTVDDTYARSCIQT